MDKLPKRTEINTNFAWHLEDIYSSTEIWEKDFAVSQKNIDDLRNFSGKISTSAQNLLDCLNKNNEASLIIEKLYVYAFMHFHEDSTNTVYQQLSSKAENIMIQYSAATAFIVPEILTMSEQAIQNIINQNDFKVYRHFLENILRQKQHILSAQQEEFLAQASEIGGAPQTIFTMLNDADMKFAVIKNEKGEKKT